LGSSDREHCDAVVVACIAETRAGSSVAKQLRVSHGLLRAVPELRAERKRAILELRADGWTWADIGAVIDVSGSTARDLATRVRPWPKDPDIS